MNFSHAFGSMYIEGKKARRRGWKGYWAWENGTIMMHGEDGTVTNILDTNDAVDTLLSICAEDWEEAE